VARWSRVRGSVDAAPEVPRPGAAARRPLTEVDTRLLLRDVGIPVVPARHVHSAEEAARAAADFGVPVAMKIVSADIPHKTDVGGVLLAVETDAAPAAYDEILASCARARPTAGLDGVLVSPMRPPGTELLVGVTRDPQWGLVLAVALGGVLVEVLDDAVLEPLPVDVDLARAMLDRLRGAAVLRGVRGSPAADLARVAEVVAGVGRLAESLGGDLDALEVNPLRVRGSDIEALDALVTWR
jgi:acetate---CoA ligase (ADP-forming)